MKNIRLIRKVEQLVGYSVASFTKFLCFGSVGPFGSLTYVGYHGFFFSDICDVLDLSHVFGPLNLSDFLDLSDRLDLFNLSHIFNICAENNVWWRVMGQHIRELTTQVSYS